MKLRVSDLWSWQGEIDRGPYLAWGVILVAIKYNVDRLVLRLVFDRDWSPADYFRPISPLGGGIKPDTLARESLLLLLIALPFLWAGIGLSLRRLRSAELPRSWVILFVVPWLKWILFAGLLLAPRTNRESLPPQFQNGPAASWLDRVIPQDGWGAAALAVLIAGAIAVGGMLLGVWVWSDYGWTLFTALPFTTGFLAALIHSHHRARSLASCIGVAGATVTVAAFTVLLFAFEGIICVAMAAPIMGLIALVGGAAGYAVQLTRHRWRTPRLGGGALAALPVLLAVENWQHAPAPLLQVTSTIEIHAPPEVVWRHVIAFAELPPPTEWLFRFGLAYPTRARIDGAGPGAIRHCEFSTGSFVEPIEVWDEPRLLRFTVTHNPAPMQEWTFYDEIHPPHLDGFLVSERGQFELAPTDHGGTRVRGTTWYRHNMEPARYWQLWSNFIIHQIHLRVLRHVKQLAENDPGALRIGTKADSARHPAPVPLAR